MVSFSQVALRTRQGIEQRRKAGASRGATTGPARTAAAGSGPAVLQLLQAQGDQVSAPLRAAPPSQASPSALAAAVVNGIKTPGVPWG